MVILITGSSHVGKTALAQKLLEKYNYPYLSIDHIKMGLIRSKNTNLTPYDDDELVPYLWNIIKEIIKISNFFLKMLFTIVNLYSIIYFTTNSINLTV